MEITRATRTHLIYQFIILTLLFVGMAFNEILPDRKYILILALSPIFCYQLVILSCCLELMPVPSWMSFLQPVKRVCEVKQNSMKTVVKPRKPSRPQSENLNLSDIAEAPTPYIRRWEKSVMNLGASPKRFVHSKKSKSWMNLSDARSSEMLSSREGSLDSLVTVPDRKCVTNVEIKEDNRKREERMTKAKSWRNNNLGMNEKSELTNTAALLSKSDSHSSKMMDENQEQSEFEKSYSFPFRQKRLQTWFETRESDPQQENEKKQVPYWESVGYNLAVKYEARRRRRATSQSSKTNESNEELNFQKSGEYAPDLVPADKPNPKKMKSAAQCMNKIKIGFTNLLSKKKEEGTDINVSSNKVCRSSLFRSKNKSASFHAREKEHLAMPEFPRFLNNDRPLFFYPRNIPFEKERFESDVQKRVTELDEEKHAHLI